MMLSFVLSFFIEHIPLRAKSATDKPAQPDNAKSTLNGHATAPTVELVQTPASDSSVAVVRWHPDPEPVSA